jgi:PQQ-dependent dehydrogenase (s-GDH family)
MRDDVNVRKLLVVAVLLVAAACTRPAAGVPTFTSRVVVAGLDNPYEIIYGPDRRLWVTEKSGRRVLRVDPATGAVAVAGVITEATSTPRGQDGLLGMALRLPHVYLAYSHGPGFKIARYEYDAATGRLGAHTDLVTGLPTSPDHDSGRLVIGPDDRLYYSIGDQGNGQFARACRPIRAQDTTVYEGKVLRINLDGSVPADNPFGNYVFSYGHRNPQGLVFAHGRLYSSEQGPKTDDELNLIRSGGNYGWPRVAGFLDDKAYAYANWAASPRCRAFNDYTIPASVPTLPESSFTDPAFEPPLRTFYTVPDDHRFQDPRCADDYNVCWPTLAPSSLDHYDSAAIPGWRDSLLMATLKDGAVYRIPLGGGEPVAELRTVNRYRDTAVSPDGRSIFVATDRAGTTRDQDGRPTGKLADPGAILEFRY